MNEETINETTEETEELRKCYCCGAEESEPQEFALYETFDGDLFCEDCLDEHFTCDCCEYYHHKDQMTEVYNQRWDHEDYWCEDCAERHAEFCGHCATYVSSGWVYSSPDFVVTEDCGRVCQQCWERADERGVCSECGDAWLVAEGEGTWDGGGNFYCDDCELPAPIADFRWSFPIGLDFLQMPTELSPLLYLGVELEADSPQCELLGRECAEFTSWVHSEYPDQLIVKDDGSLRCGFEINSQPCTFAYHTEEMPWKPVLREAILKGFRGHNVSTAGLHVHTSRDFFNHDDSTMTTLLAVFVYKHQKEFEKLARRGRTSYTSFKTVKEKFDEVTSKPSYGWRRYQALNYLPEDTIEWRLFKSTLKYSTFIATLGLVDAACRFVHQATPEDILARGSWKLFCDFISSHVQYNGTRSYIESHNIWDIPEESLPVIEPEHVEEMLTKLSA